MLSKAKSDKNRRAIIKHIDKENTRFALKCVGGVILWSVAIRMLAASNDNTNED